MFTIISLPSNFIASTTGTMSDFFTDMSPIVALIAGILLGVVVIEIIIGAIKR